MQKLHANRLSGFFITTIMMSLLAACSSDDDDNRCSTVKMNEFVYESVMTNTYYWYDKVPVVDWASYPSPAGLLKDLIYDELDRWSYITTAASHSDWFEEGKYLGMGFSMGYDEQDQLFIRFVYPGSPIDQKGLVRGDQILEINGKTIEEINSEDLWGTITGPDQEGTQVILKIKHSDQSENEYTVEKAWITVNTVPYYNTIQQNEKNIGYLVFTSFIKNSFGELDTAFDDFQSEGIDELILDLRYNSGGLLSVATRLASLISGDNTQDEVFIEYKHNDKYTHWNESRPFENPTNALDLDRVVVITTEDTCSASESVINSLTPFVTVVTVGDTTCGKPVGMYFHEFCDLAINAIEFEIVNADGEGGYFDGISADCQAGDDLTHAFGEPQEASLQEALYYLQQGDCSTFYTDSSGLISGQTRSVPMSGFRRQIGAF